MVESPVLTKFNRLTPLFITTAIAAAFYLRGASVNFDAENVVPSMIGKMVASIILALFFGSFSWFISIILYRRASAPIWWKPKIYAPLAILSLIGILAASIMMIASAPGDTQYVDGTRALARGDYKSAVNEYETLIDRYPKNPHIREVQGNLPKIYVGWIKQLTQDGDYKSAVNKYETLIDRYPENPHIREVQGNLPKIYMGWIKQLTQDAHYMRAAMVLKHVRNSAQGAATSDMDDSYQAILAGLSQDSGPDGRLYMTSLALKMCQKARNTLSADAE